MGDFNAVRPGTDLSQHARHLRRPRHAVIGGGRPAERPRALVERSRSRVLRSGLDPDNGNRRDPMPFADVERRRRESPLSLVIGDLLRVMASVAAASHLLLVVTDPDGVILWRAGPSSVRRRADSLGFPAEHVEQAQHSWYCTAHPIHDPRGGELLGIVDVSGPALTLHPAIAALVETAVKLAEAQLWRHHAARLERLRRSAEHIVATTAGPLLIVDDHGWVAQHSGVASRERIEVRGEAEPWRSPLTRRHAEILTLLHSAGPDGLTADRLSCALHGDDQHVVTVRAEISRLRRVIGALVTSTPYRLAPGVAFSIRG